jgi:hypothetical protein
VHQREGGDREQGEAEVVDMVNTVSTSFSPDDFLTAREKIVLMEAPGIHQRSMVRHLDKHVDRLHRGWFGPGPPSDANA